MDRSIGDLRKDNANCYTYNTDAATKTCFVAFTRTDGWTNCKWDNVILKKHSTTILGEKNPSVSTIANGTRELSELRCQLVTLSFVNLRACE